MKIDEIREMSDEELRQALEDNKQELFNLRFQIATRKTKNHQRISAVKQSVARIQTTLRERELMVQYGGADFETVSEPAAGGAASRKAGDKKGSGLLGRMRRGK